MGYSIRCDLCGKAYDPMNTPTFRYDPHRPQCKKCGTYS